MFFYFFKFSLIINVSTEWGFCFAHESNSFYARVIIKKIQLNGSLSRNPDEAP